MKVSWSVQALEQLVEIAKQIRWDKPGAARQWVRRLHASAESLLDFPYRARIVPELAREDVRELLVGNYRLIYRIGDEEIVVLTVRHGSRLLDPDELR